MIGMLFWLHRHPVARSCSRRRAGLAVAGSLRDRGLAFELLEKTRSLAASWHGHYDSLRLHTDKRHSALPGRPYPAEYPRYVTKGQFLDYLQDYADRFDIRPR